MFAIQNKFNTKVTIPRNLKNLQGEEVLLEINETVTLLLLQDSLGTMYFAIQKKTKGLLLLPLSLFESFTNFKRSI